MARVHIIVAGVDGCRSGWVCFTVDSRSQEGKVDFPADFATLINCVPKPNIIAIDVPIGLWEKGDRCCDKAARVLLGKPRRCSVFPPPPRSALEADTYQEASGLSRKANGKRLSKQSFGILPKIRQVDELMTPELQKRVFEVHPEVSFWALNDKRAMRDKKSSQEGKEERLKVLLPCYPCLRRLLADLAREQARDDDLLDAAVAAWTAERIAKGQACRLSSAEVDSKKLRMEIVY